MVTVAVAVAEHYMHAVVATGGSCGAVEAVLLVVGAVGTTQAVHRRTAHVCGGAQHE